MPESAGKVNQPAVMACPNCFRKITPVRSIEEDEIDLTKDACVNPDKSSEFLNRDNAFPVRVCGDESSVIVQMVQYTSLAQDLSFEELSGAPILNVNSMTETVVFAQLEAPVITTNEEPLSNFRAMDMRTSQGYIVLDASPTNEPLHEAINTVVGDQDLQLDQQAYWDDDCKLYAHPSGMRYDPTENTFFTLVDEQTVLFYVPVKSTLKLADLLGSITNKL